MLCTFTKCTKISKLGDFINNACRSSSLLNINNPTENHRYFKANVFRNNYMQKQFSYNVGINTENENINEEINYEAIAKGDKNLEHKLKVIVLEAEVMRQEGKCVPPNSFLKEEHWKELLSFQSRSGRRKYFEYLFRISKKKENRQAKKADKKLKWEEFKFSQEPESTTEETIEDFALKYDLQHNNIFLRIYDSTIMQLYNNRLIQAMMYGQKLIVDCGYDVNMTKRENLNCAKQLMLLFAENRMHDEPFDLHYCNTNQDSDLIKGLHRFIPTMYEPSFPLNLHQASYLDLFPKDQLVYLTPHCREELVDFNHDDIYIIGAIVDKINNEPLSLAKAKREGLRMAKFPLDKYLQWGAGSGKSLTLNQAVSILLDVKYTGNWKHALRHVPKRKVIDYNIASNLEKAADQLRYDRPRRERKWVPSSNVDFGSLGYNKYRNSDRREKGRFKVNNLTKD